MEAASERERWLLVVGLTGMAAVMLGMSVLAFAGVLTVTSSNAPPGWDRWLAGVVFALAGLRFGWKSYQLVRGRRTRCRRR